MLKIKIATNKTGLLEVPVDPAGGCCYRDTIKPCKSFRKEGKLLSNTSITYPLVRDTLGKLSIRSDREGALE